MIRKNTSIKSRKNNSPKKRTSPKKRRHNSAKKSRKINSRTRSKYNVYTRTDKKLDKLASSYDKGSLFRKTESLYPSYKGYPSMRSHEYSDPNYYIQLKRHILGSKTKIRRKTRSLVKHKADIKGQLTEIYKNLKPLVSKKDSSYVDQVRGEYITLPGFVKYPLTMSNEKMNKIQTMTIADNKSYIDIMTKIHNNKLCQDYFDLIYKIYVQYNPRTNTYKPAYRELKTENKIITLYGDQFDYSLKKDIVKPCGKQFTLVNISYVVYKVTSKKNELSQSDIDNVDQNTRISHTLHANLLLFDHHNMEVERFEPHGMEVDVVSIEDYGLVDPEFEFVVNNISTGYKYIPALQYCPTISVQRLHAYRAEDEKFGDIGFCVAWSLFYFDMRMINENYSREQLMSYITNELTNMTSKYTYYLIAYYSMFIYEILELTNKYKNRYRSILRDLFGDDMLRKNIKIDDPVKKFKLFQKNLIV